MKNKMNALVAGAKCKAMVQVTNWRLCTRKKNTIFSKKSCVKNWG